MYSWFSALLLGYFIAIYLVILVSNIKPNRDSCISNMTHVSVTFKLNKWDKKVQYFSVFCFYCKQYNTKDKLSINNAILPTETALRR